MPQQKRERPDWGKLFDSILAEPGRMGEYYRLFHNYSLGNQALAMFEMEMRGIPLGPISSFNGWKKLGRKVKKGEKAIALWMPVVKKDVVQNDDGTEKEVTKRFFIMKNNWFALSQTEPLDPENPGAVPMPETPEWDRSKALANLGITEVPFTYVDGNCQGFARPDRGEIAINPLAAMPWKTTFHEIAHCLLHGKQAEAAFVDGGYINCSIEEAEAEAVAYLCCATLGLPGLNESRGYIQDWLGSKERSEEFAKKSAARVFAAADKILKAGTKSSNEDEAGERNITFVFHSDPSHGWLCVPKHLITDLAINPTRYSYVKGDMAYLEEDLDMQKFLAAYREKYGKPQIEHVHTDQDSPIRTYKRWPG